MRHTQPHPLHVSVRLKVANETSLNQMADSVDAEQYVQFANSVRQ